MYSPVEAPGAKPGAAAVVNDQEIGAGIGVPAAFSTPLTLTVYVVEYGILSIFGVKLAVLLEVL